MALFAIIYSVIKRIKRWDQSYLDIILVSGDALDKTLGMRILLTAGELQRNFELGEETAFPQFRENKYGITDLV